MAFFTANKRGKMAKNPGRTERVMEKDLPTMYSPCEFGGARPDSSRRMTGLYGKTTGKRNEVNPEVGENSRRTGRMFSWMKGESY